MTPQNMPMFPGGRKKRELSEKTPRASAPKTSEKRMPCAPGVRRQVGVRGRIVIPLTSQR